MDITKTIIIFFMFGLIVGLPSYNIMQSMIFYKQDMQDKCEELGYEELTDYQETGGSIWTHETLLECDNKVQYGLGCEPSSRCIRNNKWGECLNHVRSLRCWN